MKSTTVKPAWPAANEIARGATEDQAVAAVKLDQYSKLYAFAGQREVVLRRIYKELKGTLQ